MADDTTPVSDSANAAAAEVSAGPPLSPTAGEDRVAALEAKLADAEKAAVEGMDALRAQASERQAALEAEITARDARISELTGKLEAAEQTARQIAEREADAVSARKAAEEALSAAKARADSAVGQVSGLEKTLTEQASGHNAELAKRDTRIARQTEELQAVRRDAESLRARIVELENSLKLAEESAETKLRQANNAFEAERSAAAAREKALREDLAQRETRVQELSAEIERRGPEGSLRALGSAISSLFTGPER